MLAGLGNGARDRTRTCTGDALKVVSLLVGLHEQNKLEPPAGDAPAQLQYKGSLQAAAGRQKKRQPQGSSIANSRGSELVLSSRQKR